MLFTVRIQLITQIVRRMWTLEGNWISYFPFIYRPNSFKREVVEYLYKHFLLLNCAIRLLICSKTCLIYNNQAKDLLNKFVQEYSSHYGEGYVGYNVHSLIHISDFVLTHGNLDLFSAFKYENYLQFLKKSCKNDRFPLQDAYNRIIEKLNVQIKTVAPFYPILKKELNDNFNSSLISTSYEQVILEQFIVSSKNIKDKYFMLYNNVIIEVSKIIKYLNNEIKLEVKKFKCSPMIDHPITSDITKLFYIYEIIPKELILIDLNSLKYKCFVTSIDNNKYIAIALIHT